MTSEATLVPRVTIKFCTQCRWMLRAAYFAQELLSTFGTAIGEVALQPTTGGVFRVDLTYVPPTESKINTQKNDDGSDVGAVQVLLWDRKAEGGFPETKVLKQRVRDRLEPGRDLGHSDVHGKGSMNKAVVAAKVETSDVEGATKDEPTDPEADDKEAVVVEAKKDCEDCR